MSKKHPGFETVAKRIAKKEGISLTAAEKILASQTRGANASAKRHNSHLKRVK